jgi:hypothetical protein
MPAWFVLDWGKGIPTARYKKPWNDCKGKATGQIYFVGIKFFLSLYCDI